MSTRSGDLDPGVLVYLLEEEGVRPSALNDMINRKSGLLGVSRISSDMKDLLDKEEEEPHAAAAVNLFCYQAKKFLAALAATLGGLDTLIFSAGVGENDQLIATISEAERTRWQDEGLQAAKNYYYRIYVRDKGGHATPSNEIEVKTAAPNPLR